MQNIAIVTGVLAGLLQLVGYYIYGKEVFSNHIKPNTASWGIWTFGSILETTSYMYLTNDLIKNLLPIVCSISVVVLFVLCTIRAKFEKLTHWEIVITITDLVALIILSYYQSAMYANFLLIFSSILSFVPIFLHTWKKPESENALPWYVWSLAYFFMSITVLIRWNKWQDFLYPLSFFVLHLIIAFVAVDNKYRNKIWRFFKQI